MKKISSGISESSLQISSGRHDQSITYSPDVHLQARAASRPSSRVVAELNGTGVLGCCAERLSFHRERRLAAAAQRSLRRSKPRRPRVKKKCYLSILSTLLSTSIPTIVIRSEND